MSPPREPSALKPPAPFDLAGLPLRRAAAMAVAGLLGGYLYHHYVGCLLGGCATEGPLMSMLHGALVGIVVALALP